MKKVFVDMGGGVVFSGTILRNYTWGALVECDHKCFKIGKNLIFDNYESAKKSSLRHRETVK